MYPSVPIGFTRSYTLSEPRDKRVSQSLKSLKLKSKAPKVEAQGDLEEITSIKKA